MRTIASPLIVAVTVAVALALAYAGLSPALAGAVGVAGVIAAWLLSRNAASEPVRPEAKPEEIRSAAPAAENTTTQTVQPSPADSMAGELAASREIQMRLVPHTFPPLPGCPPFDLFALIEPAREIGGDFYDFWMLGKKRLALVMADVSGKGLPAALYMAMSRTYLRAFSRHVHDPAKLLERLNREVARHNPGCMFVTVFCAIIDLTTGEMEYANAGHNPPVRKARGKPPVYFDAAQNPPVGFMEDMEYVKAETRLEPGEMVLFYTDGVSEAMNARGEMFNEDRVLEAFQSAADCSDVCRSVTMQMRSEIADFVGDADQYDDITIMAFRQPDGDDWLEVEGCAEQEMDMGDSAMMSLGGENSFASLSSIAGAGAGEQFHSLTDFKQE